MNPSRLASFLRSPFDASVAALEPIVTGERSARDGLLLGAAVIVCWYLYVPVHELLHAAGCALSGGSVTTLEIQHQYGGGLLAELFPFVRAGGEYAGRLSDFDTHGSDLVYLATDALPFSLSLLGVPLLRSARRGVRPLRAGAGFVLGLAPFYNIPGDYFEMGSILVTMPLAGHWQALRSDDLFRLAGQLASDPAGLGLEAVSPMASVALVALSGLLAVGLAYSTWGLSWLLAQPLGAGRAEA